MGENNIKEQIIKELKKLSGHNLIELTSRGNTAIFAALYCARKIMGLGKVLIPDQGGWLSYQKYPKHLEMETVEVKTDKGLIDLNDLKEKVKDAKVLLYSDYAGYFAEQDVCNAYNVCKGHCLVILDITASIGYKNYGKYCDFAVCSMGKWKPINLGYGGFLSTNKKILFEKPREIFNTTSFEEQYYEPLLSKLNELKKRQEFLVKECKKIKKDLKDFNILHKDKLGINVVIAFNDEKEKIINYCKKNNYKYTLCPRYIRVNQDAISIEVKRLEVN